MQKYWGENARVQKLGPKIFKTIILGSLALLVFYIGIDSLIDFIRLIDIRFVPAHYCTADCSSFWMIVLFLLLGVSILGLLLAIWKAPGGFWFNFLLVLWGFLGVMYIEDAWAFSWQPATYYGAYPDHAPTYMGFILKNLLYWVWCVIGVAQLYLPKRIRKYVVWMHSSVVVVGGIGGLMLGAWFN